MILGTRYNLTLPTNPGALLLLPEIGREKTAVVLFACGFYRKMGFGPGADTHVLKFCGSVVNEMCEINIDTNDLKSIIEEVMIFLPSDPGIHAK